MKKLYTLLIVSFSLFFPSCVPEAPMNMDYRANFEALWKIIDERYCFLEEKEVNWDAVYTKYLVRLKNEEFNDLTFFKLLSDMLAELKDGHVNLISSFDTSSYNGWIDDSTKGLNIYARNKILRGTLMTSGGMHYNRYRLENYEGLSFGYIQYSSFSNSLGDMSFILQYFKGCQAIILDVRSNGGGLVSNSDKLVSYFLKEKTLVGYSMHKTGPERTEFSEPKPLYISPNEKNTWTDNPVIVLQDRGSYSATNDFLYKVDVAENVYRLGLPSGGGAGLPATSELPNGWRVRYSAVKNLDREMRSVEQGIEPDIYVENESYYTAPDANDTILMTAIWYVLQMAGGKFEVDPSHAVPTRVVSMND